MTRCVSRQQRDSGAGPATVGSGAAQPYPLGADLSRSPVPPLCQGEGSTPEPPKKGMLSAHTAEHRRFNRQSAPPPAPASPSRSSNMRPGRKRQEQHCNPVRFCFSFFLSFAKASMGHGRGRRGKGLHDTKETAQSSCQVGTLEPRSCRR